MFVESFHLQKWNHLNLGTQSPFLRKYILLVSLEQKKVTTMLIQLTFGGQFEKPKNQN